MPGSRAVLSPDQTASLPKADVRWTEFFLVIAVLLVFSEGILLRLFPGGEEEDGSPFLRLLWLPIYGIVFLGLIWKALDIARLCLRLPFLMILIAICAVSFTWSIEPGLTQRRSLAIIMTTATGLYIGTRYDWQTLLRALGLAWFIVAIAAFLTGALNPSFGRVQEVHIGAWQGLYFEKNQLGGSMALAATFAGFLAIMDQTYPKFWIGFLGLTVLLVLLSTSKTALLGLLLGLGILGVCALMKRGIATGLIMLWLGVIFIGLFASVLIFMPEIVFELLGRDMTLTGRTDIWIALVDYIQQRPLFGYGYGVFWSPESGPGNWVRETLEWDAPTAHNGWLEVALSLGLVGLAFLALDFAMTVWRAIIASINTWVGVFALGFLAQFFLFSLSESSSLQQNSIVWVIYVAIATKLAARPKRLSVTRPAQSSRKTRFAQAAGL